MARKTKEDAELTRLRIVDAAREVFLARGVSRTTMEHIAAQAGVTRGAVYWHFNNKAELIQVMREQVFLPLIDRMDDAFLMENAEDPLTSLERFYYGTIQLLEEDTTARQTYEIMMIKCEYVDEFAAVLQQILSSCSYMTGKIQMIYERAKAQGLLRPADDPAQLAIDSHLFFCGLLHMWVKDCDGMYFRQQAKELIKSHIRMRRNS